MSSARSSNTYIATGVLKRMFISGARMLEVNKAQVDALNVFPVPDGDTGTNMSLTMTTAVREIADFSSTSMQDFSHKLSKGALRGARGNSGVILSQIIKGFCAVIGECETIDTKIFAKALSNGAELAYSAVSKPKEGTILTVVRMMAESARDHSKHTPDMSAFLEKVDVDGQIALQKTPDQLDVLKKAGVVDSGGFGLLTMFRGMIMGYLDQEITGGEDIDFDASAPTASVDGSMDGFIDFESLGDINFGYCTEFFIINMKKKTTVTDIDKLRDYLNEIGDSVIAIGDLSLVKVHVHTNKPGMALTKALQLGEIDRLKIDNMMEQNRQLRAKYEAERKPIGMLSICSGDGISAFFKDLLVDQVIEGGQTMNPSAEDIANAAQKINAENVIILPNNKNIILSAEQSRALIKNRNIYVIPTKDMQQGLTAALNFDPDADLNDNLSNMNSAFSEIATGAVTFAVRDTQIGDLRIKKGDYIGLQNGDITKRGTSLEDTTIELIGSIVDKRSDVITLYYGHDVTEDKAEAFAERVQEAYPDQEVIMHFGGQALYYYLISVE